jgi:hypothetical protein
VQDVLRVQVVQAVANLDEELPNCVLTQVLPIQLLQIRMQISVLAKLHDYINLCIVLDE